MTNAYFKMQRMLRILVLLTCCLHYSQGSSCMAPPVRIGDEAKLTCWFGADISQIQRDVFVYRYKDDTEYPVVIYAWHEGQAKIQTMEGYQCEGNISDYLVIKIINVNENNAGQYSCLVALSKDESTTCTLNVTGVHSSKSMTLFTVTEKHAFQAQTISMEKDHVGYKDKLHILVIVLGALLGVLVIIFIAILITAFVNGWICTCCRRQKSNCSLNCHKMSTFTNNNSTNRSLSYDNQTMLTLDDNQHLKLLPV